MEWHPCWSHCGRRVRVQMIPPSSLVISQGWGLIDLPLRASNAGSPRPRVARAQKIIRLHPLLCSGGKEPTWLSVLPLPYFVFRSLPEPDEIILVLNPDKPADDQGKDEKFLPL